MTQSSVITLEQREPAQAASLRSTDQEDDVSVEVDAELDAVYDLLPGPAWDPEVGDQSHDGDGEEPAEDKQEVYFSPFFSFFSVNGASGKQHLKARREQQEGEEGGRGRGETDVRRKRQGGEERQR